MRTVIYESCTVIIRIEINDIKKAAVLKTEPQPLEVLDYLSAASTAPVMSLNLSLTTRYTMLPACFTEQDSIIAT